LSCCCCWHAARFSASWAWCSAWCASSCASWACWMAACSFSWFACLQIKERACLRVFVCARVCV
jgi:hypothetical protein